MDILFKYCLVLVIFETKIVASINNNNASDKQAEILWQLSDLALQSQGRQYSFSPLYSTKFQFPSFKQTPQNYPPYYQNTQSYYQNYDYPQPSRLEYLQGEYPSQKYPNYYTNNPLKYPYRNPYKQKLTRESIMDVLFSVAQNDDLQCVPKLVCELTSGTMSGRQLGLPVNISPETLIGLLTTFNSAQSSPIVHFGKAAFLGLTSKGNSRPCALAYASCPSDSDKLITYLNNHKGGFFRFFQGLMSQPQSYTQYKPYEPQNYAQFYDKYKQYYQPYAEKRIITHVPTGGLNNGLFFNDDNSINFPRENTDYQNQPYTEKNIITHVQTGGLNNGLLFNDDISINFPRENTDYQPYPNKNYGDEFFQNYFRSGKKLAFPNEGEPFRSPKRLKGFEYNNDNLLDIQRPLPYHVPNPMIFPDRTGTGELKLDYSEIGNTDHRESFSFPSK